MVLCWLSCEGVWTWVLRKVVRQWCESDFGCDFPTLPRCVSLWFLTANLPGRHCYEVSWLENNRSSCPHVTRCPQSYNNLDKFYFVLNSKDTTHTPGACKQQFLLWQRAGVSDISTSLVLVVLASWKTAAVSEAYSWQEHGLLLRLHT